MSYAVKSNFITRSTEFDSNKIMMPVGRNSSKAVTIIHHLFNEAHAFNNDENTVQLASGTNYASSAREALIRALSAPVAAV